VAASSVTRRTDEVADTSAQEERVPRHVAIIMDGNRRWARARGVPEAQGHAAGVEAIRPIVEHAVERGIEALTIYAFSRENWRRSSHEVETLIGLLEATIRDETPRLIEEAILATAAGERMVLNVAFNYSSRSEIVDAVRAYVDDGNELSDFDEEALSAHLYTAGLPDPDLLVRTGGDQRISNFLLWQAAYAELYFCDAFWPDFGPAELDEAIEEFNRRARRFGR
jgi:undecaprenyl diphosphate synthase